MRERRGKNCAPLLPPGPSKACSILSSNHRPVTLADVCLIWLLFSTDLCDRLFIIGGEDVSPTCRCLAVTIGPAPSAPKATILEVPTYLRIPTGMLFRTSLAIIAIELR